MSITDRDAERLNLTSPAANDIKLGEIVKSLQDGAGSGPSTVDWASVTNKPTAFTPAAHNQAFTTITGVATEAQLPTLAQTKVTNLTTDLAAKLTATKAAAQANSTATDVAGLVADFNALLAKLKTAGVMS